MVIEETSFKGILLIKPRIFADGRGQFYESYRVEEFRKAGIPDFLQDNVSSSIKNVIRGLHYQLGHDREPAQGKLVCVPVGNIRDVVVDIRKKSPTYAQHKIFDLNDTNRYSLWIPPGFAHGFLSLQDNTIVQYKCTTYYNPESERGIRWNDPDLNIPWNINDPIMSEKDKKHPFLKDIPPEDLF